MIKANKLKSHIRCLEGGRLFLGQPGALGPMM